jgi:hypothetical protein
MSKLIGGIGLAVVVTLGAAACGSTNKSSASSDSPSSRSAPSSSRPVTLGGPVASAIPPFVVPSNATVVLSEMGNSDPFIVYDLPTGTTVNQTTSWFMKYDPPGQNLGNLIPKGTTDDKSPSVGAHFWCDAQNKDYLWLITSVKGNPWVTIGKGGTDPHCRAA